MQFEDPRKFDTGLSANRHLALVEMRTLPGELLDRIETVELEGDPVCAMSTFICGLNRLSLRIVER
ncbi:hypothetical protein GRI58_11195 [Porphyrobacter algicida]|uniref:Uncharacterized protein n=1 Tax=Qipengyuania algicida TaxID=1836209 RepID=A0A845AR69_9SPHN|nr:hypothetical protein [Qipengyuania algicida]MXP29388.1 hypothetical protein [Qipengyuania algicida]